VPASSIENFSLASIVYLADLHPAALRRPRVAAATAGFQARKSSSVNPSARASSDTKPW
jgi:hypothetical protein